MPANTNNIQARLFEMVSRSMPDSVSLVDELSNVLNLSDDSIRRRLRGETLLTINEIDLLCNMYKISFDSVCHANGNTVVFDFNSMSSEKNFEQYILSILHDLEAIYKSANGHAIYAGEDIPLFHNFGFPALSRFKIFYWMKSIMNVPALQGIKYDPRLVSEEILAAGTELFNMYAKVNSTEIWTEITPVSLFKQIEFFLESDFFESAEQAMAIYEDIKQLFLQMEKSTQIGCKFDSNREPASVKNNFQLYSCEIEIGNNCIITDVDGRKKAYLAFNTFNKLSTCNAALCGEVDLWLNNLIRKSTLISGISEKKRSQFFKSLYDSLNESQKKITG
jgi:hypothetical protein